MRILLALLVGFILAAVLYLLLPLVKDEANRVRQRFYFWLARHNPRLFARVLMATMVQPPDVATRGTALVYSDVAQLIAEHNRVVDVLRILTAKLDLDAGVTDANYAALVTAATGVSPARITAQ